MFINLLFAGAGGGWVDKPSSSLFSCLFSNSQGILACFVCLIQIKNGLNNNPLHYSIRGIAVSVLAQFPSSFQPQGTPAELPTASAYTFLPKRWRWLSRACFLPPSDKHDVSGN